MNRWNMGWICLIIVCFGANAAARSIPVSDNTEQAQMKNNNSESGKKNINMTFLDSLNRGKEVSVSKVEQGEIEMTRTNASQQKENAQEIYRIQILASSQVDLVHSEKDKLGYSTSLPLVILYDNPFYKLFAGSFKTKSEAESRLPGIKELGYEDAWIVNTGSYSD